MHKVNRFVARQITPSLIFIQNTRFGKKKDKTVSATKLVHLGEEHAQLCQVYELSVNPFNSDTTSKFRSRLQYFFKVQL